MREHHVLPVALGLPLLLALSGAAMATAPAARPAASPQADGVAHTLRQIPEACIRLQGMFTGRADQPYALQAVPTQERCPRRAVFAGISDAPQADEGWQLDEQIMVPSAACPALRMTLSLWRHPGQVRTAERDGQGQVRVYVEQARQAATGGGQATLPQWRASWQVQGRCR
jgi:hypothetical protein